MEGEVGDDGPLRIGRFAPDEDFAVVGGGCEDGAVLGMCLSRNTGQNEVGLGRGYRGERTHETHQTAPSCLDYGVNANRITHVLNRKGPFSYPRSVSVSL